MHLRYETPKDGRHGARRFRKDQTREGVRRENEVL